MKADHVLTVLGILIIGLVLTQFVSFRSDPIKTVEHECAFFYRQISPEAESRCRSEMRRMHSLTELKPSATDGAL